MDPTAGQLAQSFGFRPATYPLDFLRGPNTIAERKLEELKFFLEARKAALAEQARRETLGQAALAGANPTPEELASFKPGLPSVLDLSTPASATPPATGNPPILVPSATPEAQRLDVLDTAAAKNAPAVEAVRRSLALHDVGINEAQNANAQYIIAHARATGSTTDEAQARFDYVQKQLNNPDLNPLLGLDIAQKKSVFKPQRVIQRRGGIDYYMDATPNLSGGTDYTPALDQAGQPLQAPAGKPLAGDRPTALQKNAAFISRVLFAGDPDAEEKAVTLLTQLKGKSPRDAWAALTQFVARLDYGTYAANPDDLYNKTAELWRVSRPGEAIPANVRPASPAAPPGRPATVAKPAGPAIPAGVPAAPQRKAGTVYQTPRGPMTWTGTGWLPPP